VPGTLVLRGGTVVDGTGGPPLSADVAVQDGAVVAVGHRLAGDHTLDCTGHVVSPGFIDTHSHSDVKVLADSSLPMKVRQGITLEVFGQDGISVAPVKDEERAAWKQKLAGLLGDFGVSWDWSSVSGYLSRVRWARPGPDVAYLAPHGAIRQWVMGGEDRRPSPDQTAAMQAQLRQALAEGACGMSTGLIYPPCCYADTAELIALGRVLAEARRPLVVHMRSESDRILEAVGEMVTVAHESGCHVHISHLKLAGRGNWGRVDDLLGMVERAQADGLRFTADQYPYVAGSTLLGAILPPWAHVGGIEATLVRLRDDEARARMKQAMADAGPSDWDNFWSWSGPEGIVVADIPSGRHPEWLGKSLAEVARMRGQDPFEAALDLLLEERMGVAMISFSQDDAVVERIFRRPWVNACTDGLLGGRPHPRAYGTYPRILGRFVRDKGLVSLEEAVRKLTSQAARAFGFEGCGLVRPGYRANLVVFDAAAVADLATFEEPARFPAGIRDVLVGGEPVVRDGEMTRARPGKIVD